MSYDDLHTWLRAQLDARAHQYDEDERVAQTIRHGGYEPPTWHITARTDGSALLYAEERTLGAPADEQSEVDEPFGYLIPDRCQAEHITRWDPKRVLDEVRAGRAEITAARRILGLHDRDHDCSTYWDDNLPEEEADDGKVDNCAWVSRSDGGCSTVRLLALRFAGQDGYRDEWRPYRPGEPR